MIRELLRRDTSLTEATPARHYYLMAELRRAAIWAIVGCLLIAPVAWYVGIAIGRDPAGLMVMVVGCITGTLWLSQYLLPRVKVDDAGIHRRILWWWDPWHWNSIVTGQVRDGVTHHSYQDPGRPWWRRDLRLGYLEEADAKGINDLIRRVWVPPALQPLPEMLELRITWPDSRVVQLSREQIVISKQAKQSVYRWDDVVGVILWRLTHDRMDFRELQLRLPDQELTLRRSANQGNDCLTWRGPSAEVIAGFVCHYVNPNILRDFSLHNAPKGLEEVNARQEREEAKFEEARMPMKWCMRVAWGLLAAMPFCFRWPNGVIMAGIYLPLTFAMHWMCHENARRYERQRQEFEAQRRALITDTDATADGP